jgi:cytosine/adenosine deaminase-related metal-dependent hydrolase
VAPGSSAPSEIFRARWVLPISEPAIEDGFVEIANGRIVSVGPWTERWTLDRTLDPGPDAGPWTDLGDSAILPGLVNAHTHLELSWMADRVPPKSAMDEWIRELMAVRRAGAPGGPDEISKAAIDAAMAMVESGTVLVGDISNTLMTPGLIAASGLRGVVFHELIGFAAMDPDRIVRDAEARLDEHRTLPLEFGIVAHAPYSVSPDLIAAIARAPRTAPLAIHLGESVEEMEFIATGQGPIRKMLEHLGVWSDAWVVPACDPAEYVDRLGYLRPGTLVIHGVQFGADAIARIHQRGAVLVSCPRSNTWVGSGPPPLAAYYRAGVPVAFGTDSLASAPTLNLFDELAEARRIAPEVPASLLVESATRRGAEALGLGEQYGTIEPGKRAALISVRLRAADRRFGETHVRDAAAPSFGETAAGGFGGGSVEEYLVSGNVRAPEDVRLIRSR